MNNKVFRKVSVERLSSPEQLDSLMRVTSPRGWLALLAIGLLLATAILWGIFGSLSTKLNGQGVLIKPGGIHEVFSSSGGQMTDIRAVVDEQVERGDVIARIAQPQLLQQLQQVKDDLTAAKRVLESTEAADATAELQSTIVTLEKQRDELLEAYMLASRVVSPYTGRVLEVKVKTGDMVSAGTPVITIEQSGGNLKALEAVMYIPAGEGKKVIPGMEVQIAPASINKEEYGFMQGRVISVSEFPASRQGMMITLGNEALVNQLSYGASALLEVRVDLIPDIATVSGYKWSSGDGPPTELNSGTLSRGSIVLKKERPIASVIPQIN